MKRITAIAALALTLATSGAAGNALATVPARSAATPVSCTYIGAGKHRCSFYVAGDGIHAGTPVLSGSGHRVGSLNYGDNWVVCQQVGREQGSGANHDHWWAWTKANDRRDGWVNALYAHGGANDGPFSGVPSCAGRHGSPPHAAPPRRRTLLPMSPSATLTPRAWAARTTTCPRAAIAARPAYPLLVAADEGWRLLSFAACSGATTQDVLKHQINAVTGVPTFVTISVGGDDANFSGVVKDCLLYRWRCASSIHKAESFICTSLPLRLDEVFAAIQSRDPHATVFVIGYAHLFKGTCHESLAPFGADQRRLNTAADIIDDVIGHEAGVYGFTFVIRALRLRTTPRADTRRGPIPPRSATRPRPTTPTTPATGPTPSWSSSRHG